MGHVSWWQDGGRRKVCAQETSLFPAATGSEPLRSSSRTGRNQEPVKLRPRASLQLRPTGELNAFGCPYKPPGTDGFPPWQYLYHLW